MAIRAEMRRGNKECSSPSRTYRAFVPSEADLLLPDDLVRWISAVFFVAFLASTLLFFPRAARRGERRVRTSRPLSLVTGPLWDVVLFVVFLAPLAEALLPDWVYGGPLALAFPLDSVFQGLGAVVWLAGGALALWAQRKLGRFTRSEIEVLVDHRLVTEGPYRWIRHPLYTAVLLMSVGIALLLLNAGLIGLSFAAYGIARHRVHVEEGLLASEGGFGQSYRAYMEQTGRFLPRWGRRAPRPDDGGKAG